MRKGFRHIRWLVLSTLFLCVVPVSGQTQKDLPALSNVERDLKGGETHAYKVQLSSGQFLHAIVEQENCDVVTATFGPDGKQINESDSLNGVWGSEPVIFLAPSTGEYRVEVRSADGQAPVGRYRIKIIALREASPIDKGHAAAQLACDEALKLIVQQNANATRAAIQKYDESLPLFRAAGDKYREAIVSLAIGDALYNLNDYRKALDYFNQTLKLAVEIDDRRLESGTETYIGGMLDIIGDAAQALVHQERALKLAREQGWQLAEGSALSNIGKL